MTVALSAAARELLASAQLAHLVTIEPDGSPQITCVWVKLDHHDEIVFASLGPWRKLANIDRDPRVSLSIEAAQPDPSGMQHYLVIHGTARKTEGGGPELLQELAHTYVGPDVKFPPMDSPPPGVVVHITIDKVTGNGPWLDERA